MLCPGRFILVDSVFPYKWYHFFKTRAKKSISTRRLICITRSQSICHALANKLISLVKSSHYFCFYLLLYIPHLINIQTSEIRNFYHKNLKIFLKTFGKFSIPKMDDWHWTPRFDLDLIQRCLTIVVSSTVTKIVSSSILQYIGLDWIIQVPLDLLTILLLIASLCKSSLQYSPNGKSVLITGM